MFFLFSGRLLGFQAEVPDAFSCKSKNQTYPKVDSAKFQKLRSELSADTGILDVDLNTMLDRLETAVSGDWRVNISNNGASRKCVPSDTKRTSYLRDDVDVLFLQKLLKKVGSDPGPLDGLLGKKTSAAICSFQRKNGLSPDYIFGPKTFAKLRESLCENENCTTSRSVSPGVSLSTKNDLDDADDSATTDNDLSPEDIADPSNTTGYSEVDSFTDKLPVSDPTIFPVDLVVEFPRSGTRSRRNRINPTQLVKRVRKIEEATVASYNKRIMVDFDTISRYYITTLGHVIESAFNNVFSELSEYEKQRFKESDIDGILLSGEDSLVVSYVIHRGERSDIHLKLIRLKTSWSAKELRSMSEDTNRESIENDLRGILRRYLDQ